MVLPYTCVVYRDRESLSSSSRRRRRRPLACPANEAIGDFPLKHVACAWTLTVRAGEKLYEKSKVVCTHDCIQCESLRSLCFVFKSNRLKPGT